MGAEWYQSIRRRERKWEWNGVPWKMGTASGVARTTNKNYMLTHFIAYSPNAACSSYGIVGWDFLRRGHDSHTVLSPGVPFCFLKRNNCHDFSWWNSWLLNTLKILKITVVFKITVRSVPAHTLQRAVLTMSHSHLRFKGPQPTLADNWSVFETVEWWYQSELALLDIMDLTFSLLNLSRSLHLSLAQLFHYWTLLAVLMSLG